jgi:hypothetical protein
MGASELKSEPTSDEKKGGLRRLLSSVRSEAVTNTRKNHTTTAGLQAVGTGTEVFLVREIFTAHEVSDLLTFG